MPAPSPKLTDKITSWFIPRDFKWEALPERVAKELNGVPLPLRYNRVNEESRQKYVIFEDEPDRIRLANETVHIIRADFLKSYRIFGRLAVVSMFEENQVSHSPEDILTIAGPTVPEIIPDNIMRLLMPGIEDFDSI